MYWTLGVVVALAAIALGLFYTYLYDPLNITSDEQTEAVIADSYTKLAVGADKVDLGGSLDTFLAIATDETRQPHDRAVALNGINYAYTQSNFDASTVYEKVFSKPPYNTFYTPPVSEYDPLHPEEGGIAGSVEAALVKLNELSNQLSSSHYAISRMEVGSIFAYQRANQKAATNTAREDIRAAYGNRVKALIAQYDTLGPLESETEYSLPMRMQIMLAHAGALSFVGRALRDRDYTIKGEDLFADLIKLGGTSYETSEKSSVLNMELLGRIFYASYHWQWYKDSNPDKIRNTLRPLTYAERNQLTTVHQQYLPSLANSTVPPATVLREIAETMPELKAYLQTRGWIF